MSLNELDEIRSNLGKDDFFINNTDLYIIDDYHLNGASIDTVDHFVNAFADTGVETITIFIQAKKCPNWVIRDLNDYCANKKFDAYQYVSFLTLVGIPLIKVQGGEKHPMTVEDYWGNKEWNYMRINSETTLNFIDKMANKNITVQYQYYNRLNVKPPFHGRYWITPHGKGYIVDGSLSTIGTSSVLAQIMDDVNYRLVATRFLADIVPNIGHYVPMDKNFIMMMRDKISALRN